MARKKKVKPFSATVMVREMARERIGAPPVSRVVPDRKKKGGKTTKHKPTLNKLLEETE